MKITELVKTGENRECLTCGGPYESITPLTEDGRSEVIFTCGHCGESNQMAVHAPTEIGTPSKELRARRKAYPHHFTASVVASIIPGSLPDDQFTVTVKTGTVRVTSPDGMEDATETSLYALFKHPTVTISFEDDGIVLSLAHGGTINTGGGNPQTTLTPASTPSPNGVDQEAPGAGPAGVPTPIEVR